MPITYTPSTWTDEVLVGAERYDIKTNAGAAIETNVQVNLATSVSVAGTSLTASLMNNIEDGIETIDVKVSGMETDISDIEALLPTGTVVGTTDVQTLTNKRIAARIGTEASSATSTPTADSVDQWNITALAVADAFAAPTGTPTDGQKLVIRIKDNGTARALTWNAIYRAVGTALPTTSILSKTLYLGFVYNAADTKWDLVASAQQA